MKYAIIRNGGHEYKVTEGETLEVELVEAVGKVVTFSEVLLVVDGENVQVGTPTVAGMTVTATLVDTVKGDKIQVFKYKSKSRYRKLRGHRQQYSRVMIESIGAGAKEKPAAKPAAGKPAASAKSRSTSSGKKPAVKRTPKAAAK